MKTLFTSNHKEADTKIVYCCSSFNKSCIVKTKGIDILILMIYAYAVQQIEHDWYIQTDKDTFVGIRKIYEKQLDCCCHSFMQSQVVIGLVTSLCLKTSSA